MTQVAGLDEDARKLMDNLTSKLAEAEASWAQDEHDLAEVLPQVAAALAALPRAQRRRWRKEVERRLHSFAKERQRRAALAERVNKGVATGYIPEAHDEAASLIAEALKDLDQ